MLNAQTPTSITLDQARQAALAYHPTAADKQHYLEAAELRASNVRSQWLPQVKAVAQGTYQSEVTEFDLSALGFPAITISPDQYKAGFEVQQNLLDLGTTRDQRELELTKGAAQAAQADVDLLKVGQRVDEIYGNILLQQANLRILRSRALEIGARQERVASAVRNGMSLQSNEEVLRAEGLVTQQRIVEARTNLVQLTQALGVLMGQAVDTAVTFTLPEPPPTDAAGRRPELRLFELQENASGLQAAMVRHKNQPRLGLFADGYYGRPGFNFLNNNGWRDVADSSRCSSASIWRARMRRSPSSIGWWRWTRRSSTART
jgi:outer membrane protein TolC